MKTLTPLTFPLSAIALGATSPTAPVGTVVRSTLTPQVLYFDGTTWDDLIAVSGGVTSVTASGNLSSSGGTTPAISLAASPTFTVVTAAQFNGSGAGLSAGSVPNAALATTPVTAVTASGNLVSSGGSTPALTITANPTFTSVTATGQFTGSGAGLTAGSVPIAALATAPVLVSGAQTIAGVKTFSSPPAFSGASITAGSIPNAALATAPVTSVGVSGNITSTGGPAPTIGMTATPTFTTIFTSQGVAPPAYGTRSAGTAIVLSDHVSVAQVDYALGIDNGTMWLSISNSSNAFKWYAGTTVIASLTGDGTLSQSSDATLKSNVIDTHYGLGTVRSMQPRDFTWKDTGKFGCGFIAQEAREVVPELISEDPDGLLSMNYAGVVPVLVAALKELAATFDAHVAAFSAYVAAHP
jgi:hypothetical protein